MPSSAETCVPFVLTLAAESRLSEGDMFAACGEPEFGLTVESDQAEVWFVKVLGADPVSNASEDRADVGTSNDTPDAARPVAEVGRAELGFVKVTVCPCKNCTPPSSASDANEDDVQREASVADDIGRALCRKTLGGAMPERRFSSFASSNGLTLSVGLTGLIGSGTAAAAARPGIGDGAVLAPILTRPACPFCSSTRRAPWAETGVIICGGSRM